MRRVAFSAPGKLILMGEHAVVYGHPALVAALDLRLVATIAERRDRTVVLDLPRIGYRADTDWAAVLDDARRCRCDWQAGRLAPSNHAQLPARVASLALGEACEHLGGSPGPGLELRVDSQLPPRSGFGSSAAVAVAVAAAYLALMGVEPSPESLFRISLEVERRQHGTPSGIDNRAVLEGGILWAERRGSAELTCAPIDVLSPAVSHLRVYQSGVPNETTGAVVAAVRRRGETAPHRSQTAMARIAEATRLLKDQLVSRSGDPAQIVAALRRSEAALEALGVVPDGVRSIFRRVEAEGGAAKISGAGALSGSGAGAVIVYHPEPGEIDRWPCLSAWTPLPVLLGAQGLRGEVAA